EQSLGQDELREPCLRLCTALASYWWMRGHASDGRRWLAQALQGASVAPELHARALHAAGTLAFAQSDFAVAARHFEAALAVQQERGTEPAPGIGLHSPIDLLVRVVQQERGDELAAARLRDRLGTVYREQGRLDEAKQQHEQALEVFRRLADEAGEATAL